MPVEQGTLPPMEAGREMDYVFTHGDPKMIRMRADGDHVETLAKRTRLTGWEKAIITGVIVAAVVFGVLGGCLGYALGRLN
jgi:hypothetical protein